MTPGIIEHLTTAVMLLDEELRPTWMNPAAETLLAVSGYDASERAIGRLIGSALDIIIQLVRMPDGRRMVSEVIALTPTETDAYHMDSLYRSHEQ